MGFLLNLYIARLLWILLFHFNIYILKINLCVVSPKHLQSEVNEK